MDLGTPRYAPLCKIPPPPCFLWEKVGANWGQFLLLIFPASVSSFNGWRCRWVGLGLAFCHLGTAGANSLWNKLRKEGERPLSERAFSAFSLSRVTLGLLSGCSASSLVGLAGLRGWVGGWRCFLHPRVPACFRLLLMESSVRPLEAGAGKPLRNLHLGFSLRLPRRDYAGHGFSLEGLVPSLPSHCDSAA